MYPVIANRVAEREAQTISSAVMTQSVQYDAGVWSIRTNIQRALNPVLHIVQRGFDLILSSLLLIIFAPLIGVRAILAKRRTGQVFTHTYLIGQHHLPFEQWHFADWGWAHSLPALWNVLKGDMQLFGPHPVTVAEYNTLGVASCFRAKPGMIPYPWQYYEEASALDKQYIGGPLTKRQTSIAAVLATTQQQCRFYWHCSLRVVSQQGNLFLKRLFDIVVAGTLLLLILPTLLLTALLIRLDSVGPILFAQKRVGKNGKLFTMWKFRSMYIDAEARKAKLMQHNEMRGGVLFKMKKDPRITRIGVYLRKFSVDELPQLWNVLVGEMSLVGPRPPLPAEVAQYTPYQRQRLSVTPGITCIWQVSGRSDIPFEKQVDMDLEYIRTQSFWGDIVLLLKTIPAVLNAKGAY